MAKKKERNPEPENVGESVEEAEGFTTGRTTQERRIGSGNFRTGHSELEREVDAMPKNRAPSAKRRSKR